MNEMATRRQNDDLRNQLIYSLEKDSLHSVEVMQHFSENMRSENTVTFANIDPNLIETGKVAGAAPGVKQVVYNDPATVVYWDDGTKTVVKCHEEDVYDERTGFLLCCAKKLFGNTGRFNEVVKEHAPEKTRPVGLLEAMRNLLATVGA